MEFLNAIGTWCGGLTSWQGGGHGWGGWMPFHFGGIFQLLVIGLIIYFTVKMIRKPAATSGPGSPETLLRRRYARGEIDEETYRKMKDELKKA